MNCEELRPLVDDLVDGELSRPSRDEANTHVSQCPRCRGIVESTRRLAEAAASLPREMAPGRGLWSGIEPGLAGSPGSAEASSPPETPAAPERRERWWLPRGYGLAAAMIAVLAGLGLVASGLLTGREGPREAVAPVEPPPAAVEPAAAPGRAGELNEAQRVFLQAKQELREAFSQQRSSLSPATVRKVNENLKIIEEAVSEIQGALDRDPGNLQLERMLVAAQQREVALLRKVTWTAASHQR